MPSSDDESSAVHTPQEVEKGHEGKKKKDDFKPSEPKVIVWLFFVTVKFEQITTIKMMFFNHYFHAGQSLEDVFYEPFKQEQKGF